jgi:hypothetical protein
LTVVDYLLAEAACFLFFLLLELLASLTTMIWLGTTVGAEDFIALMASHSMLCQVFTGSNRHDLTHVIL